MVLENSSSKEANESFDHIPASDNDPYASSEHGQGQYVDIKSYQIDIAKLPKPLPIFGPLFGFNATRLSKIIHGRIQSASNVTKRSLRQYEIDALAYHTAVVMKINSFAPAVGLSAGIYSAIKTASTFRFPFYQPNLETFNSKVFPHPRMPYIKGGQAVISWHIFRGLCYCYVGQYIARFLISGYASTVGLVGEVNDPRLKDVTSDNNMKVAKTRKDLPSPAGIPRPRMKPGQEQSQSRKTQEYDDASPISDAEWSGEDNAPVASPTTPKTFPTNSWPQRRQSPAQTPAQEEEKSFDLFTDASPTGGQGMDTNTTSSQSSNPTSSSGSAWDRIRRGEKLAPLTNTPSLQRRQFGWPRPNTSKPPSDGVASEDSYTFSKTEAERNLAQVEAQKEFDERVERERQGGYFNGGRDRTG